ncbi:UDP-N-acetylmuramate dehydrogenase [Labilibacter sediminis]|nr:UDP-N-acetylmuramate dehydrogenase [Labilibacter sediminis]
MVIQQNYSLKPHHTFHFNVQADFFVAPESKEEVIEILKAPVCKSNPLLILGGGSNILFKSDYKGLILKPNIQNITVVDEQENNLWVEVGAGVDWDYFVEWSVKNNLYGIENLSLIPGNVGACPVQNIGAYGVEVKDVIKQVNGVYIDTLESFSFKNEECDFAYRNSIFKNHLKGKVIITSVVFELKKQAELKLGYGDVLEKINELGEQNLVNTRKAIVHIRESKLPDPEVIGNVGSFFKNPVVENSIAHKIIEQHNNVPHYKIGDTLCKIPAGWMIEQCGWKGRSLGNAAVHEKQALVLVNKTGKANGEEVLRLASEIEKSVKSKFGITIEKEVNVI